jgi:SAM-dependent methyltransferase
MSEKWRPLYYGTHTGVPGDISFYLGELTPGIRILELGCGSGRLTEKLLAKGHEVVALDHSGYAISCVEASASALKLEAKLTALHAHFDALPETGDFDCVIMSFNALLCLDNRGKQAILEAAGRAMKPGGCFLFDFYDGADFLNLDEPNHEPWLYEPEYLSAVAHDELIYDVYQSGTFFPAEDRIVMHYDHFPENSEDPDESLTYEITHHLISLDRLESMLGQSNLKIERISKRELEGSTHLFLRVQRQGL